MRITYALASALFVLSFSAQAIELYDVTDLGPVHALDYPELQSIKIRINDAGKVSGWSRETSTGWPVKAFYWDALNGRVLLNPDLSQQDAVLDMNNDSVLAGWQLDAAGKPLAVTWTQNLDRSWSASPLSIPGAVSSEATAVDALGNVAAIYKDTLNVEAGYMQNADGTPHTLSPDLITARPYVILDGVVVGEHFNAAGEQHSFTLDVVGNLQDLGSIGLSANFNTATGMNGAGTVVGGAQLDLAVDCAENCTPLIHAMSWDVTNGMQDLLPGDSFYSWASEVNASGLIVGKRFHNSFDPVGIALLWEAGTPYDLNALTSNLGLWKLGGAHDINGRGEIVGIGEHDGLAHAFLLTPNGNIASVSDLSIAQIQAPVTAKISARSVVQSKALYFRATNFGPDVAEKVNATFALPEGLEVSALTLDKGVCHLGELVSCDIPSLGVDEFVDIAISFVGEGQFDIRLNIESLETNSVDAGISPNNRIARRVAIDAEGNVSLATGSQGSDPASPFANFQEPQAGGGCTIGSTRSFDPVFYLIAIFSLFSLYRRRNS